MRDASSARLALRAVALALLPVAVVACGLVESDIARFDLTLPKKPFRLDTADWMLTLEDATMPSVECPATDCAAAAAGFCAEDACDAACVAGTCQLQVNVAISQTFNLDLEAPELDALENQPVIDVTLDTVGFDVTTNTLNVTTPPLAVFMAPQGIMDPTNSEAVEVGAIEPIPPGTTGRVPLVLTDPGKVSMKSFLDNYKTPFNIFVAGQITVQAGDPVPEGALAGEVLVTAYVSP
jgi:hypothetical protein